MKKLLTTLILFIFLLTPVMAEVIYDKTTGIGIEYCVLVNDYGYYKIREITTHRDTKTIIDIYYPTNLTQRPFKSLEELNESLSWYKNKAKENNKNWKLYE